MTTIRAVTSADSGRIAELCGQLGYPSTSAAAQDRLERLLATPDCRVLVAEMEGRVVGVMQVSVHRSFESGDWAEIDGLVMDETVRGRGIGTAMVEEARAWAGRHHVARLRVRTNEKRTRTHAFYERAGFTLAKSQRVYDMPL